MWCCVKNCIAGSNPATGTEKIMTKSEIEAEIKHLQELIRQTAAPITLSCASLDVESLVKYRDRMIELKTQLLTATD